MKRRAFVVTGTAGLLTAGLALWSRARRSGAAPIQASIEGGARESERLVPDPEGLLDLPRGFTYRVLQRTGEPMSDGYRVPGRPDAMGCFALPDGTWALMRNHELDEGLLRLSPYPPGTRAPSAAYDRHMNGGVSRIVLDREARVRSSNLVLTGTARNCAGGMSPWGWLSCEESVLPRHGYVFLCPADSARLRRPRKISAYGRFQHEAVAIDPRDRAAYLTEDRSDGCLYRFVPHDRADPFGEGQLQAMAIADQAYFRLGEEQPDGARFAVRWVDVPARAGERDRLRYEAHERGAASVMRGEGIWRVDDGFAFTSTTGGPLAAGQIFHLSPTRDGGVLRLLAQSRDATTLDMPDNLTVTPWGDLLVCEDNHRSPCLRLVTRKGRVLPVAFNRGSLSEFAGVCFSPDGRFVFVNIQEAGLTVVIEGPWQRFARG